MLSTLDDVMRSVNRVPGSAGGLHGSLPHEAMGWIRCGDIDSAWMPAWESKSTQPLLAEYGRADPMAACALAVIWYAEVPGRLGGAALRPSRQVPQQGHAH